MIFIRSAIYGIAIPLSFVSSVTLVHPTLRLNSFAIFLHLWPYWRLPSG